MTVFVFFLPENLQGLEVDPWVISMADTQDKYKKKNIHE